MWNMFCFLSPPSLTFPHLWELCYRESPERLHIQTVAVHSEEQGWISDVWAAISCNSLLCLMVSFGSSKDYQISLGDSLCTYWFKRCTLKGVPWISMVMHQYTVRLVTEWFDEHEGEFEHLPWPAQAPDLNIFFDLKMLWDIFEKQVRKLFPHYSITMSWRLIWKKNGSKSLCPLWRP